MPEKLILDVDTGIDDAIGILLAVKSKNFDLLGITTVSGNVSLNTATINTCKILDLLGSTEIPVVKGAESPLFRKPVFEHRIHGEDGLGGALKDIPVSNEISDGFAPDFIINSILSFSGEVTLICTGPLTNLALAVKKCPQITKHVKKVIFMGGVVRGVGNITPTAEFNAYVDPEAAKIVLQAGFPSIVQVGLDVTRKALLTRDHIQQLKDEKLASYLDESTSDYQQKYYSRYNVHACAMHDPLAVGIAINSKLVVTEKHYVDVETKSELCDGQFVCDFQNRLNKEPNLEVCLEVDTEAFFEMFIETLNSKN
ncbi:MULTISPECIES: nucleoside hydrolase [unclassified Niallia]|uniref:nucleoside hydrolase n=1 Tax=unclassified Niallia TaxID=2837522 RepID=UPI001EDAC1F4|nr:MULTISPECIES: nucleoside hydrolase [unclassified Niallia]MDL0434514.1 nucleoside hydrolase [Niallia sp. SS-2023]UPO88514.1 nucleoside hydrolase [Niallia sp. Man26]